MSSTHYAHSKQHLAIELVLHPTSLLQALPRLLHISHLLLPTLFPLSGSTAKSLISHSVIQLNSSSPLPPALHIGSRRSSLHTAARSVRLCRLSRASSASCRSSVRYTSASLLPTPAWPATGTAAIAAGADAACCWGGGCHGDGDGPAQDAPGACWWAGNGSAPAPPCAPVRAGGRKCDRGGRPTAPGGCPAATGMDPAAPTGAADRGGDVCCSLLLLLLDVSAAAATSNGVACNHAGGDGAGKPVPAAEVVVAAPMPNCLAAPDSWSLACSCCISWPACKHQKAMPEGTNQLQQYLSIYPCEWPLPLHVLACKATAGTPCHAYATQLATSAR